MKNKIKRHYSVFVFSFLAFFATFGGGNNFFMASASAQLNQIYKTEPKSGIQNEPSPVKYQKISGRVVSANHKKQGLRASVYVRALHINVLTDEKGNFSLSVPESVQEDLTLIVSANGKQTLTQTLSPKDFRVFQKILLSENNAEKK